MRLAALMAIVSAGIAPACAARAVTQAGPGIVPCRTGAVRNYMAAEAQQCWYSTPQGRWRIVNHEFHYDSLVMQTQATSPELSGEIVRRLTAVHGERFAEILLYVEPDPGTGGDKIRRVRWTRSAPPEQFDFPAS